MPDNTNGKPMLADLLKQVPDTLKYADEFDVERLHKFLIKDSHKPLLVLGNGSTSSQRYAAMLYGMYNGIGNAMTPYMANSLSDAAIKNSKILLITNGGNDPDVRYITKRILEVNPTDFMVLTSSVQKKTRFGKEKRNYVREMMTETNPDNCICYDREFGDGFLAVNSSIFNMAALYRAFTSEKDLSDRVKVDLKPESCFTYSLNGDDDNAEYTLPSLDKIKNLVVLHGNMTQPIAYDIESKMVEGGLMSVQVSDYRNFCHGRFIFISNHVENSSCASIESDTALVMLVTPREKQIVKELRDKVIPKQMPLVVLTSGHDTALATVDLEIKAGMFCSELSNANNVNINDPKNYAKIDKLFPRNGVKFEKDFKEYGCLTASGRKK